MIDYIFALDLAVLGYVITCILMDAEGMLSWYDDILIDIENKDDRLKWITYPLGRCEKCFTGQLAFWVGLQKYAPYCRTDYVIGFLELFIFTAYAIIFVMLIKGIIKKWNLKR